MTTRRSFLAALAALPILQRLLGAERASREAPVRVRVEHGPLEMHSTLADAQAVYTWRSGVAEQSTTLWGMRSDDARREMELYYYGAERPR